MTVDMATLTAIPAGVYYAGYILDNQNDVIELNELDNISSFSTLQITKPTFTAPDLVMQTAGLSSTTAPTAGSIAVTSKVKNIGTGNAGASQLSYYLSTNASLNPNNDVLLTIDQVSVLNPNDTDNETATLTIPSGTAAGNYHILFVADALNNVNESDENNNVLAKAITVTGSAANLKVQSGSTNLAVNGTTIDINFIVGNDGTDTSANSVVGYYLSTDASITTSDYLIGTDNVGALAVGNTSTESITIDISSFGNIPTGNYYIGLLIDHQNTVSETNENDNQYVWTSPLYSHTSTSIPDLIVQNATVDTTTISTGSIIHTTAQVKNAGLGTAVASMLGYYLSTDPTFDPNVDIFLGDDQVNVLNSNETDGETGHLTIPTNTMNGTYYLLFVADYIAAVVETNENNNVSYKIITVNNSTVGVPNLRIQANTAVLSVSGTSVNVDIVVENNGTDTADASMIYYYLSANTSIDASDYLIGTDLVALLAPNQNSQKVFAIDISTLVSIPAGTYYIGCVVDAQNVVVENDETDNSYYWASTQATQLPYLPADLTVNSAVATPNSLAQGSNLSVTAQVQNIGASMALPTQVGYYLSSDNVLDSSTDVFLGQSALDTIAVNESLTASATLPISTNISNGTYYILVVANDLSSILEGDVTNNVSAMMITVDSDYSISPFAFTPTNQSGIFLGQATVAQNAASPNDWIAAFDTSGNCAGAAQIINNNGIGYISLTIYGDDPNTSADEGIGSGEYFTLKLYDASANRFRDYPSFDVKNQFTQWSNVNGGIMPAYSSVDSVYNFVDVQTDTILLNTGWNLISFDLLPYDSSLTTIFDELIVDNTLEYVIGFNGGSTFYDANGQPFLNTLTHIDNGYGYWVKVNTADTVVLKGWPMSVADHKIDLNTGWNLAAYVPQTMATPESYYQTLIDSSSLTYITGFDNGNQFFNPNGQPFLNTLTHLNNGFGYWVKVSTSFDGLSYRGSGFAPTNVYDFVNGSTNLTEAEYVGEEINVLDEEGNIVATLAIIQGGYVMTTSLYGDDLLTSQKDGIDINDPLYFEFRGQILDVGVVFEGSMKLFQVNLQYNKAMLTNTNEVGQEFVQFNCYPNPTSGEFTIEVNKEIKELFITDANGKILRSLTNIQKGTRRVDLSGFSSGMYFLRYIDGETTGSKRIILVK
jgi:subtilase family serine protease